MLTDKVVITTPSGNIDVTNGHFFPEGGALELNAPNGNIDYQHQDESDNPLNLTLNASGQVNVKVDGAETNGGDVTITAATYIMSGVGIMTKGGDVLITTTGSINIDNGGIRSETGAIELNAGGNVDIVGVGAQTENADITITGADLSIMNGGISTGPNGTGDIALTAINGIMIKMTATPSAQNLTLIAGTDILIMDTGIDINGGNLISTGVNFTMTQSSFMFDGSGDILIDHTGDVIIQNGGAMTMGGNFTSRGQQFTYTMVPALATQGGNILIDHTGDIEIGNGGFRSGTGTVTIGSCFAGAPYDVDVSGAGIHTEGAEIIIVAPGGTISSAGAGIRTGSGTGGTIMEEGNIVKAYPSVNQVGTADITLNAGTSQACLLVLNIPTMGQWSLFILALLISSFSLVVMLRHKTELV